MKKIFYVLSILLYFYLPKISSAATVLSQDQASGYFQVSGDGATYFISTDETRVERLGQYTIQFKTQLDNFKFATPTGTPVASVTVSIRRHGPEYFSPGRLYYFCRMGEEFNLVYSSTVVTSEDWDGLLNQGRFVDYTFNFPASPCDLSRVTTFSLGFERAFPDVEGTDKGSSPGVGMGVAGDQHIIFLDNYEWKIRIDSQIKPGKTPVLIVPGVTGTDLTQGEQKLWLDLERNFTDINDQFMDPLAFNQNLTPSVDGVQVGSVIAKAALNLGAKITVFDYVAGLVREFEDQGYVTGKDLFLFPYD